MSAKTRTQSFDPTATFAEQDEAARLAALRTAVLPRLTMLKDAALTEATRTFSFDVEQYSDEAVTVSAQAVEIGLHPAEGDYPALRGVRTPAFRLVLSATPDGIGVMFHINGAAEWRLFIKALYQYRETLGEYIAEFEELYLLSEEDEDAIEELDQLFAVDVETEGFKADGCRILFPAMDYPIETDDDFDTLTSDFGSLLPFYWTLLKAARNESVNMDRLLNG